MKTRAGNTLLYTALIVTDFLSIVDLLNCEPYCRSLFYTAVTVTGARCHEDGRHRHCKHYTFSSLWHSKNSLSFSWKLCPISTVMGTIHLTFTRYTGKQLCKVCSIQRGINPHSWLSWPFDSFTVALLPFYLVSSWIKKITPQLGTIKQVAPSLHTPCLQWELLIKNSWYREELTSTIH